jgi:hypothetical protein
MQATAEGIAEATKTARRARETAFRGGFRLTDIHDEVAMAVLKSRWRDGTPAQHHDERYDQDSIHDKQKTNSR